MQNQLSSHLEKLIYDYEAKVTTDANYTLVDGVLFSKDQKTLILYPAAKPGSSYTVPKGVTVIGDNAFDSNRNLTEIELPEGLEEIGAWSFSATEMLDSLRLPEGLRAIGAYAFAFGTLKSLRIPTSVKTIGDMAFSFCFGLNDIYYAGSEAQWNAIQFDNADDASPDASLHFNAK